MTSDEIKILWEFATTEKQIAHLQSVLDNDNNITYAAKALGVARGSLTNTIQKLRKRATHAGHPGLTPFVPPGFHLSSVKTQLDKDGEIKARSVAAKSGVPEPAEPLPDHLVVDRLTVQTNSDGEVERTWSKHKSKGITPEMYLEAFDRALDGRSELQAADPVPILLGGFDDMLTMYPWGDPHVGMLSWKPETGVDFDLKIAETLLTSATRILVSKSPPSARAVLLNLGDFFHAEDQGNATPGGGNQLDVDGRQGKIIDAGIRIMATSIEHMLTKHEHVTVINVRGNHDPGSALWLSRCLHQRYRNDPRVDVSIDPAWRNYMEFGVNMLGWSHGHGPKFTDLPGIMASEWPEAWGRTQFHKWYVGHFHHKDVKEKHGCTTEIYNTMAARDGWHAKMGYGAARYLTCEVYNRHSQGPFETHRINANDISLLPVPAGDVGDVIQSVSE